MGSAALLDEIVCACRDRVSDEAMRFLADTRQRARHLVFRVARDAAGSTYPPGSPSYEVGLHGMSVPFTPTTKQIEPVRSLHILAKRRGAFIALDYGKPGRRRAHNARRRLMHAVEAIAAVAPELADELRRIEVTGPDAGRELLARLPYDKGSPRLEA